MTRIIFEPLAEIHLAGLHGWLQAPHVREFWDDGDRTPEQVWARYLDEPEDSWVFTLDGRPAGYIQIYPVDAESKFAAHRAAVGETWGIDLFIGETGLLGRGYAVGVIEAFLHHLKALHPALSRVLIDPETRNARAIHVYGKAGFALLAVMEHEGKQLALMVREALIR